MCIVLHVSGSYKKVYNCEVIGTNKSVQCWTRTLLNSVMYKVKYELSYVHV